MSNILDHVGQSIRERKLFRRGEAILVAVSGGLDSMVLLHLLHSLAPANGWRLCIAHFNHRLRGRSSNADERLVRTTARQLGLKCVCESGDVKAHAARTSESIEMAARELRHEFLARTARQLKIRSVAVAHHADDQVELFFLRLFRGAGGEGLGGMKWRSPSPADSRIQLVRPILDLSKTDLQSFAVTGQICFREDASNVSLDIQRNRIRHELLPLLRRRYQPALDRVTLRVMEIVGEDAEAVTAEARACIKLKQRPLSDLPVGLQRRILQLELQQHDIHADFVLIEALRVNPGKAISISPRISVARDQVGRLHFSAPTAIVFGENQTEFSLNNKPGEGIFDGVRFRWRFESGNPLGRIRQQPGRELFDAARVGPTIRLRHWLPGDRFHPIGMTTSVKLQDWFTNQKLARNQRHKLIVATTAEGEIFWVEGQRMTERFKLTAETSKRLVWRWQRG